jgi:hypothetical protein
MSRTVHVTSGACAPPASAKHASMSAGSARRRVRYPTARIKEGA